MTSTTLSQLGCSEADISRRLNELGGATPENIAKVIAENNRIMLNQLNTLISNNLKTQSK